MWRPPGYGLPSQVYDAISKQNGCTTRQLGGWYARARHASSKVPMTGHSQTQKMKVSPLGHGGGGDSASSRDAPPRATTTLRSSADRETNSRLIMGATSKNGCLARGLPAPMLRTDSLMCAAPAASRQKFLLFHASRLTSLRHARSPCDNPSLAPSPTKQLELAPGMPMVFSRAATAVGSHSCQPTKPVVLRGAGHPSHEPHQRPRLLVQISTTAQ
jgi:hypothetical protein